MGEDRFKGEKVRVDLHLTLTYMHLKLHDQFDLNA